MIKSYTLEDSEIWDKIVKSFANHDVYYLSGYVRAFQLNGDGEPELIYFEKCETRAINVVIRRDLADCRLFESRIEKNTLFDFITPYGYGGFLIEGSDVEVLQCEYEEFCRDENIVSEFVRFHPQLNSWCDMKGLYTDVCLGKTVYMDTSDEDTIWKNITSKNRNVIRKARKSGLHVYWGRSPEIIQPFIKIYNETMEKDNADDYYYFPEKVYQSILEDLKYNAMWFCAQMDGEIAAISIFMFCNERMHYHLSASQKKYQSLAPSNILLYEAALWAANNGYKTLHLGGGVGAEHDGLYKFKKAFNREADLEFHIGKRIFDRNKYKELCRLRKIEITSESMYEGFFPRYREESIM